MATIMKHARTSNSSGSINGEASKYESHCKRRRLSETTDAVPNEQNASCTDFQYELAHRSSISLNNMAINLLEHGSYEKAMEVLKGAISIMTAINKRRIDTVNVQEISSRASKSFFAAKPRVQERRFKTLVYDYSLESLVDNFDVTPFGEFTVARFEPWGDEPKFSNAGLDLILLMCNFAVTSYLLSTTKIGTNEEGKFLCLSRKVLKLALLSVDKLYIWDEKTDTQQAILLSVALLGTGTMCKLHVLTENIADAITWGEKCVSVSGSIEENEEIKWVRNIQSLCTTSAAAAA